MSENIFEALRESHAIQRSLMRKLMLSHPGERRRHLFADLRAELGAHEAAEERFLYVPILMDNRGLHSARDALSDHHKLDKIVDDLRGRDHNARGWMNTVKQLSSELHDHLREEERSFSRSPERFYPRRKRPVWRSNTEKTTGSCIANLNRLEPTAFRITYRRQVDHLLTRRMNSDPDAWRRTGLSFPTTLADPWSNQIASGVRAAVD